MKTLEKIDNWQGIIREKRNVSMRKSSGMISFENNRHKSLKLRKETRTRSEFLEESYLSRNLADCLIGRK
jgi:hypothetical protein